MSLQETNLNDQEKYKPWQFKPGQIANPAGRPKGSRNKLGEQFIQALQADFEQYGVRTIEIVRTERPHEYLKVVASLLPKQIEVKEGTFDGLSDEQLTALVSAARSALGIIEGSATRADDTAHPQPAGQLQAISQAG